VFTGISLGHFNIEASSLLTLRYDTDCLNSQEFSVLSKNAVQWEQMQKGTDNFQNQLHNE